MIYTVQRKFYTWVILFPGLTQNRGRDRHVPSVHMLVVGGCAGAAAAHHIESVFALPVRAVVNKILAV